MSTPAGNRKRFIFWMVCEVSVGIGFPYDLPYVYQPGSVAGVLTFPFP